VIKEHLSQIELNPASSGKQKSHLCKCDVAPLLAKTSDANQRYKNLLLKNQFELRPALIFQMPYKFVESLEIRRGWWNVPSEFKKFIKSKAQKYRNGELISICLYSYPESSPPLYEFTMNGGKNGKGTSTVFGPYENINRNGGIRFWAGKKLKKLPSEY